MTAFIVETIIASIAAIIIVKLYLRFEVQAKEIDNQAKRDRAEIYANRDMYSADAEVRAMVYGFDRGDGGFDLNQILEFINTPQGAAILNKLGLEKKK